MCSRKSIDDAAGSTFLAATFKSRRKNRQCRNDNQNHHFKKKEKKENKKIKFFFDKAVSRINQQMNRKKKIVRNRLMFETMLSKLAALEDEYIGQGRI